MNLEEWAKRLEDMAGHEKEEFLTGCVNELAARLLTKVRKRTPVGPGEFEVVGTWDNSKGRIQGEKYGRGKRKGQYKLRKLRAGGNLRRGWHIVPATRMGNRYTATVANNVRYASYVEYGHRQHVGQFVPVLGKRLKRPWVPGKHMLRISHEELKRQAGGILSRRLHEYMERMNP